MLIINTCSKNIILALVFIIDKNKISDIFINLILNCEKNFYQLKSVLSTFISNS